MNKKWIALMTTIGLMFVTAITYAASGSLFNVSATGTPANVTVTLCLDAKGPLSCQTYTVAATQLSITTTINHTYPDAGILSNTPGYTPTGCTNISNGYCLFSVSSTTPAAVTLQNNSPTKNPRFAYVTSWGGDMLKLCTVASDGTFTNCNSITAPNSLNVNQLSTFPGGIAINPTGTMAYIADYSNGVFMCNINSTTGLLSNCTATGSGYSEPLAISLNAAGTFAYIGDYSSGIPMVICSVNATTGDLTNCGSSTYSSFNFPTNVAFTSTGTKAYVGNFDITQVYLCDVNQTSGDLTTCTTTPSAPPADLEYATGVALNKTGSTLYVVSNDFSLVYKCPVNPDATLGVCTTTGTGSVGWAGFVTPFGMVLNAAGTLAYIPNYSSNDTLTVCKVDATSGELTNCAYTGSGFTEPLTLAFLY